MNLNVKKCSDSIFHLFRAADCFMADVRIHDIPDCLGIGMPDNPLWIRLKSSSEEYRLYGSHHASKNLYGLAVEVMTEGV